MSRYKIPISSLVVIYTKQLDILLLSRADKSNFWQSVTGSLEADESPLETAKWVSINLKLHLINLR